MSKRIIISVSAVLLLLIASAVVYFVKFYDSNKEEVLDNAQYEFPDIKVSKTTDIYDYLIKHKSNLNVTYNYIKETKSIQVTFKDIKSDDAKNMFIMIDNDNNQVHIKNVNDNLFTDGYDSYGMIPITIYNAKIDDLCELILSVLNQYYAEESSIDKGDAKNYGKDVGITTNPDGSLSVEKD